MHAHALSLTSPRIRAAALRHALIAGARRVMADRDLLNRINVFPVADGDTGSNLAFTLGSVLSGALGRRANGVGTLLQRVAEDAVDGGRGNSGAILAQFFAGVAESVATRATLTQRELALAVRHGAASARQAVMEPREGTMLSVIAAFADGLDAEAPAASVRDWFATALQRARDALADTPRQLPVLQRAGVVDAGAKGFVDLLEGIGAYLHGEPAVGSVPEEERHADWLAAHAHDSEFDADPAHRWCSECLVLGEDIDTAAVRAAVAALDASCVVAAGSRSRVRVHAHVASPQALFDAMARFGRVEASKADDMQAQARAAAGTGGVAVVTDSSADLPEGLADALDLHVVPLRLNFGGEDFLDKVGLSPSAFYRRLRQGGELPRTSQPPPGDFRRQFEFLLSHHPQVLYLGVARAVSGTLQAAETAAQRGEAERILVFDTANAAGGQALLALAAARMARTGMTAEAMVDQLQALRERTVTWGMARDVSMAVRGGRLPRWAKVLVDVLRLVPLARMSPKGRLRVAGALWGRGSLPARFAAHVARRVPPGQRWRVIVGHCDAAADGQRLLDAIRTQLDCDEAWLVETGPAIGAHAGPETLLVSLQPVMPAAASAEASP